MSADEGFPGILESDADELKQTDQEIRGRDQLPWWFDGVTVDSVPAIMLLGLKEQILDLENPLLAEDRETSKKLSILNGRLDVIYEFHKGHRKLHTLGFPLPESMALQYALIKRGMADGSPPWNGHPLERWQPYLDKVTRAYNSFYQTSYQQPQPPEDLVDNDNI